MRLSVALSVSMAIFPNSLFQAVCASVTMALKFQLGNSCCKFLRALSMLTLEMPTFTMRGCPMGSKESTLNESPSLVRWVMGCENSATKNTRWSFAHPVEKREPTMVFCPSCCRVQAVILSQPTPCAKSTTTCSCRASAGNV